LFRYADFTISNYFVPFFNFIFIHTLHILLKFGLAKYQLFFQLLARFLPSDVQFPTFP